MSGSPYPACSQRHKLCPLHAPLQSQIHKVVLHFILNTATVLDCLWDIDVVDVTIQSWGPADSEQLGTRSGGNGQGQTGRS